MIGTGGLSHQLDGERAGFINKPFDLKFMDSLIAGPDWATQYSNHELVEKTGTQGVELLMWLAARGAVPRPACARSTPTTTSRSPTRRRECWRWKRSDYSKRGAPESRTMAS